MPGYPPTTSSSEPCGTRSCLRRAGSRPANGWCPPAIISSWETIGITARTAAGRTIRMHRASYRCRIWSVRRSEFGLILILVTDLSGNGSAMRFNRAANREESMRRNQQGMTFIGLLCILALSGVIAYAVIRLVPAYLTYMQVVKAMNAAAGEGKNDNPDPAAMRRSLERHWEIEDISAVDYKDIEIVKGDDG